MWTLLYSTLIAQASSYWQLSVTVSLIGTAIQYETETGSAGNN